MIDIIKVSIIIIEKNENFKLFIINYQAFSKKNNKLYYEVKQGVSIVDTIFNLVKI